MADVGIWLLLEQQSTMTDATIVIGAYRSYEAAEAVLKAKEKAAGWTGESDDDEDREPWWEIETIMLRGEPEPLPADSPAEEVVQRLALATQRGECLECGGDGLEANPQCQHHEPYAMTTADAYETLETYIDMARAAVKGAAEPKPEPEPPAPKNRFYCPDCQSTEVHVTAQYEVRIVESGDEVETRPMDGHWDWDETSRAWCGKCDFEGTVDDFDHDLEHRYDREKALNAEVKS